ncbi:MAG: DUF4345 domain-containing protein [Paracoccaceae bacterium]
MQNSIVLKAILLGLGLPLLVLGGWRVLDIVGFFAFNGIELGHNVSMLNETRAAGGMVVGSALVILSGAFFRRIAFTSTVFAVVLFLSFGFARLYGIAVDGLPSEMIQQGLLSEFVMGSIGVFALYWYIERESVATKSSRTGEIT